MLKDLDNKSNYLESIDNGEENLEIKLENLKKNDWKRMNSPVENDNRLALVHMGFDCSLHDIYNPEFSHKGEETVEKGANQSGWLEEDLWKSEDEEAQAGHKGSAAERESKSLSGKKPIRSEHWRRRQRWSIGDLSEYQRIREEQGTEPEARRLYDRMKNHFSDFYDIEFIEQVWQMRDMRGRGTVQRTPSPRPLSQKQFNFSSESKFNLSRFNSNPDSLNVELSCINNAKSELESKWNESMIGILDNLPGTDQSRGISRKPTRADNQLAQQCQSLRESEFESQRRSHPGLASRNQTFEQNSPIQRQTDQFGTRHDDKPKSSTKNRTRFRKRKGISGTNSLSEMNGMFEESLSHIVSNLDEEGPESKKREDCTREDPKPEPRPKEEFRLESYVSKARVQEPQILNTLNGMTLVTESGEERPMGPDPNLRGCIERVPTTQTESFKVESISEQIKKLSGQAGFVPKDQNRLSYREMVMSEERGLNFLIENWKEVGTLKNPPNTIEQFSERKGFTDSGTEEKLRQMVRSSAKEGQMARQQLQLALQINPEQLDPKCFVKKGPVESHAQGSKQGEVQRRPSTPRNRKVRREDQRSGQTSKKATKDRSTPQNGKKVKVPQLKQTFSKFYLANSTKLFAKSTANFSGNTKQKCRGARLIDTPNTISDNILFEPNPPKSHRQFSKKKLNLHSKKTNSKELQKILELGKNLLGKKQAAKKAQDSLRRQRTRKVETKCFQSDRNLSIQKSTS